MTDIDRSSPIPIYHQLKMILQEQIERGLWRPGDRIPTEHELCELYGISRSPVRQALRELAYDGLLFRRPGLGTFVEGNVGIEPVSPTPVQMMSSDPHWSRVLEQVTQVWNEEHPNLRVSFQTDLVEHSQFYNLLSAAVGSGTAPDVATVDSVWVAGLARAGFLYSLDDPELKDDWDYAELVNDLYPAFVRANSFDGSLHGLPLKADASLLWYRKDWFSQESLSPPQDWDDLLLVSHHFLQPHLQERYGLTYPLAFPGGTAGGEATVYNLMPCIWSAGGELFDPETGSVILDTPETRRALQFLQELVIQHCASPSDIVTYDEHIAPKLFASGKVAMALGGSYESGIIRDVGGWSQQEFQERVGFVAPPAAPGGQPVSTVGGTSYVILRQCPSPALVMNVLRTAIRPDVVGDLYHSMLQNSPYLSFDDYVNLEAEPVLSQTAHMIATGHARPSIPEYFKVSRQLQGMFEATISKSAPIDSIVRRTAEFIGVISERPCQHC